LSRPVRILFVSQEYPPETGWGGIGTYVHAMARALARRGHEVHVLSAVVGQCDSHRIDDGVHVHRVGQFALRGLWRTGFASTLYRLQTALSNYLAFRRLALQFDVIETPDVRAEGLMLLCLRDRPPVITHVHGGPAEPGRDGLDARVARFLERLCLSRADHVTLATRDSFAQAGSALDPRRASVVPLPAVWDSRHNGPAGDAPPRVLFAGRFESHKNPRVIVEAAPLVLARVPEAQFVFVGREPDWAPGYLESCRSLAERSGVAHAVRFSGWLDAEALSALRAASRVCVVPSLWESFGMAAVESMTAGRPVIASRVAGLREIVTDGRTGALVDPQDHAAWARAIIAYLRDPALATAVGESARKEARERYSPAVAAIRREEVYRNVIATRRRRPHVRSRPLLRRTRGSGDAGAP
jgi:glycogen(starch) synthase